MFNFLSNDGWYIILQSLLTTSQPFKKHALPIDFFQIRFQYILARPKSNLWPIWPTLSPNLTPLVFITSCINQLAQPSWRMKRSRIFYSFENYMVHLKIKICISHFTLGKHPYWNTTAIERMGGREGRGEVPYPLFISYSGTRITSPLRVQLK